MESAENLKALPESLAAVFTLPDKRQFEGTITRIGSNNFELAIDEMPEESWHELNTIEAEAKKEDDKYLFLDVRCMGRNMHTRRTGENSTTIFVPSITLYTNEPDNPLSQNISSLSTNVDNLDLWLDDSLFSFHNPMHMEDSMDYMLQKEVGEYKFKGFQLTLGLAIGGMRMSKFTREVKLRQHAYIRLRTTDKDRHYTEFLDALRSFERLVGLAYRSQVTAAELDVTSNDFSWTAGEAKEPNIWPAYSIILSNVIPSSPQDSYSQELNFTHKGIGIDDFQKILDRWEELEANILPMVDVFLTSTSGGSNVLENIFLNRVQAIEGFHRAFRDGNLIPDDEYETKKNAILEKFTGKDKGFIKRLLKFGNQVSLSQRIRELDKELKLKGIATVLVCEPDIVANTRNYYSHYENDISNICPASDFGELTYQCGQMVLALILIELGLDKGLVKQATNKLRF
ncbi:MAG TPA: HEPN domain-containing protein [Candidatus Saccharimonadales bacterium]|nr:HEPN domain-containing protein [Candidatus Saccharimonadales bacterium]